MIVSKNNFNNDFYFKINLSFFEQEKTEKPTQKRKEKARSEGQVAISKEIATAILIIVAFLSLKIFAYFMYQKSASFMMHNFNLIKSIDSIYTKEYIQKFIVFSFTNIIIIATPIFIVSLVVGIITNILQVGWNPTVKPLMPKFDAFNPVNGFKRIFSLKQVMELITSILKIVFICFAIYNTIKGEASQIRNLMLLEPSEAIIYIGSLCIDMGLKVGIWFIIIAIIDFAYQKYSHLKKLRMSKQEIKDEYKQIDGDPLIKNKIRQKMREASVRRMMQEVPNADVIITNPTHYAVAIKYDKDKENTAPIVVAKGIDHLAQRIKNVARENNVHIIENKPLARSLYDTVDIGKEIPPELYKAVAEVLAFVYKLKNKL